MAENGPNDVNLRNIVLNQPTQVFLLGIIPVDITVNSLTLTLNAAGTLAPGHILPHEPDELRDRDLEGEGRVLPRPGGHQGVVLHPDQLRGGAVRPVFRR